jgi:hypothetical protein
LVIGALLAIVGYFLRGSDPQMNSYYWFYVYGYLGIAVYITLRAYCRRKSEKKNDLTRKLMDHD